MTIAIIEGIGTTIELRDEHNNPVASLRVPDAERRMLADKLTAIQDRADAMALQQRA